MVWGVVAAIAASTIFGGLSQQRADNKQADAIDDQANAFLQQQRRDQDALNTQADILENRAERRSDSLEHQGSVLRRQQEKRAGLVMARANVALDQDVRAATTETRRGKLIESDSIRTSNILLSQANDLETDANIERETAQIKDSFFRIKSKKLLSSQRVGFAKGGVVSSTGSALDTMAEITRLSELESRINLRDAEIIVSKGKRQAIRTRKVSTNVLLKAGEAKEESRITANDILELGFKNLYTTQINAENIIQAGIDAQEQNIAQAEEVITAAKESSDQLREEGERLVMVGNDAVATGFINAQGARATGTASAITGTVNALSTILVGVNNTTTQISPITPIRPITPTAPITAIT